MNPRSWTFWLALIGVFAMVGSARATTVDVCVNAATDAHFDSTNNFFVASAPIYAEGTITQSNTPIDCTTITATPIGTFFTLGGFVAGLPASAAQDLAFVIWHFRLAKGSFDTMGPVQGNGMGAATPGQTYPQTIVGATHGTSPGSGQAIVRVLDPSGFVFEVKAPDNSNH